MKADEFIEAIVPLVTKGIAIVGGCCGTTPEFIQKLKENCPTTVTPRSFSSAISSGTTTVEFGKHVVVCGERLNPTGKKKLKAALKEERYDELVVEAIKQEQAGAHVLDVNVGLPGIDEPKVMKHVIKYYKKLFNFLYKLIVLISKQLKKLVVIIMENHLLTLSTGKMKPWKPSSLL